MVFLLIWFHFVIQVLGEAPPPMPKQVLFDNWQLTWTPATEDTSVNYTVMYRRLVVFDSDSWNDVPNCKQMYASSCNVTSTKTGAEHDCVMLGVRAERHGLTSKLAIACSRQSNSCTPKVGLSVRPGALTLHLSRNSAITQEGPFIKHKIYFGKEGELLEAYEDAVSSVSIDNLKEGEHYCASVQYTYFDKPVGLASCPQCEVIPQSSPPTKQTEITVAVVIVLAILTLLIVYVLLYQRKRIKGWLQTPYKIPVPVLFEGREPSLIPISSKSPTEDICDITRMELRGS
ncbi:interferon gamma receptor 2 isoform X1 [Corythoichthys intestinalis]|uniref:interferon gamma receptor 2 isoform X1 n=1 Tax=Corythoichthys intestinalis TaxID=161448 RepID=UPI0025A5C576|nr:interferon gamma receptor 2 isoform X1 [Corythoichthys intestinalis]